MKTQVSKIIRLEPEKAVPFFEEPTDVTATIRAKLAASRFDQHTPPPPEPPVMLICGVEVAHAGNLVIIEGPNKSGKSAFYGAGIAAIMGKNAGDCLGWESDGNPDGGAVLHFDTEQSRGDHHSVIMKAQARAGVRETPAWFDSYCLTGWELAEARLSIRIALDDARAACGSVHSLWLDGGADFILSVNDEGEATGWVRELHSVAIEYGCPVFVVVHLNPGGLAGQEKSRGHFGSHVDRKAETVIRIAKGSDDVSDVSLRYYRKAPLLPDNRPQFAYDSAQGIHVLVEGRADTKAEKSRAELLELAQAALGDSTSVHGMSWREVKTRISEALTIGSKPPSPSTVERRVSAMAAVHLIKKLNSGNYTFTP